MGVVFYVIGAVWCVAIVSLIALKRRFWPPVYSIGIPVLRLRREPLVRVAAVGSLMRSTYGTGKVIAPGRIVFLGSKFFRSPVALIATVEASAGETSVVARIPADAVCGAALCIALSFSVAAAIFIQGGSAVISSVAALMGVGLVVLWWTVYRFAYLGARKRDVISFLGELEASAATHRPNKGIEQNARSYTL
jgi:hypothetical protein